MILFKSTDMNHKHIARRFEENDHIFKNFLRDVAVFGNNHYFCRNIYLIFSPDGENVCVIRTIWKLGKNKFIC